MGETRDISKRHEERAREIAASATSGPDLCRAIASARAATEAELVGRMMEGLLHRGEKYAARRLAHIALENDIPAPSAISEEE